MVFSDSYRVISAYDERRFNWALQSMDLESAVSILENLPRTVCIGDNCSPEQEDKERKDYFIWRARVLVEGYRAITRTCLNLKSKVDESVENLRFPEQVLGIIEEHMKDEESSGQTDSDSNYTILSPFQKLERLRKHLNGLRNYQEMGTLEQLGKCLAQLKQYKEIGTLEELDEYKKDSNSIVHVDISPLESL